MSLEGSNQECSKSELITKHRIHEKDTGSPEVQIGILTQKLNNLMEHFKSHPLDAHSKRGLFATVSRRKRLLEYLKNEDVQRYRQALDTFGLRK